ncbi:hypothetical protein L2E82_39986 [Cichorium intybus]|uniref:Uncharacterized protein n=1 Tax=Cichorium intybus TaxID=13427 RepID=A0ACB9AJ29_CICIN|nr:hypothetical protein L2E82_39986 [Cichorium intybus]
MAFLFEKNIKRAVRSTYIYSPKNFCRRDALDHFEVKGSKFSLYDPNFCLISSSYRSPISKQVTVEGEGDRSGDIILFFE